jgi:hypothetical protein
MEIMAVSSIFYSGKPNKITVDGFAHSCLLHSTLYRYGIETIPETMEIRMGDQGASVRFDLVRIKQDHNYRTILKRGGIFEVETLSAETAMLPINYATKSEEEDFDLSDENENCGVQFEMCMCFAIDQLLNHLVSNQNIPFGGCLKELCVSNILIPSIASSINAGLEMLFTSPFMNSESSSQQIIEAILLNLGETKMRRFEAKGRPLVQKGVEILLQTWFERSQRSPYSPK